MSTTAPGFDQQTGSGGSMITSRRLGTVTCRRVTGEFDVRGENSVTHIKDGWLCQDERGYFFGLEDGEISGLMAVPPTLWTDSLIWLTGATEAVPYTENLTPPSNAGGTVTEATLYYDALTSGITFDGSTPTAPVISGTPGNNNQNYPAYCEVLYKYDNHRHIVQRYAFVVLNA